ncbi:hypothetical protein SSAG_00389 [Streptomyces sp. Mg1]|nr:hypothetical protein SSAG_00389 [Streptomyces sp. Mg1]
MAYSTRRLRGGFLTECLEHAVNVHKSVPALEKDIRDWIAAWNTHPRPYIWTKTADEILERLAGYLNRIPDSED